MVAPELTEFNRKESSMELEASHPVVVTDKLIECRDFYTRWFGFRVVFEATRFVYLTSSDEGQHQGPMLRTPSKGRDSVTRPLVVGARGFEPLASSASMKDRATP